MQQSSPGGTYQIGELAARSGVPPDTLRYYERIGLLPKTQRTEGGFRVYPAETIARLRFIKQAQSLGLTLREIRDLLGYQTSGGLKRCRQVREMLRAKLGELQAKLTELQELRRTLGACLEDCERTLTSTAANGNREPQCPVVDTLASTRQ